MSQLIALDPGGTTGYCVFRDGQLIDLGHCQTLEEVCALIIGLQSETDELVYEGFARGNSVVSDQIFTIELCGAIKALAEVTHIPLKRQFPASRTGYIPIAKQMVRQHGTLQQYHHAIDAIAHALAYMDKEGQAWEKQYWMQRTFQSGD